MKTETQRSEQNNGHAKAGADLTVCPSCHAALVRGMRFCRSCGYRLGEGMAEYVETVRLGGMPDMHGMGQQGNQSLTGAPTTVMTPALAPPAPMWKPKRGKKWMWMFLVIALFLVTMVSGKFLFGTIRDAARARISRFQLQRQPPSSFFGASEFHDTEGMGGALLEQALVGSPAERAGFLDGDIITKFDGRPINGEDALRDALRATPIGKTVEVGYLRDGEAKTTMLTTISSDDYDSDMFRPKERGMLGVDDMESVSVAGTKIRGVRLGDVYDNRPADIAGLKEGDIVVEFDGKPVRTPGGMSGYISLAKPASTIPIVIYREGQRIVIPVKMGRRN